MSAWEWLSLASLCFAGAASPGPSLAVVVSASLGGGKLAGLAAAWAHALGVGLYAVLTVLGLSALLANAAWLFLGLQSAGAIYLLWLAWGLWRSAQSSTAESKPTIKSAAASARDGFTIAFLNPKLAVFMLALFSQFVRPDANIEIQAILISTATLIDGLWYTFITLMLTRKKWISVLKANGAAIDRVFAGLLALLALTILTRLLSSL
ncbi:LysE family translocator [Congregibacter variabilis]|uniref:LysE family translocator n=1 Tax=Congregibacter variabilis TaxID=3081200 RepID=A0ABZ0I4G0_9GAMM|nr:LysE family translocator [Congregibacter sp. IMCC43200]